VSEVTKADVWRRAGGRRNFIGGSDARIIMGNDEAALVRLWREKRGEIRPEDLSGNLLVQLGLATEDLNRRWYEANTGQVITDIQRKIRHPVLRWMGATLDGRIEGSDAVFEAKFMLPWSFSEEAAAEKYMPQLQHNMWVVAARTAVLSVITGGGKWVEILAHADPLYQHLIVTAERKFWRCVEGGEQPKLFGVEPPKPRLKPCGSSTWRRLTPGRSSPRFSREPTRRISSTKRPRPNLRVWCQKTPRRRLGMASGPNAQKPELSASIL
jgi:predicted phage-related endonuclease